MPQETTVRTLPDPAPGFFGFEQDFEWKDFLGRPPVDSETKAVREGINLEGEC